VVLGVEEQGHKELLAMEPGYRESAASWSEVLRSDTQHGLTHVLPNLCHRCCPESVGAERNWDDRYTWVRHASLTLDPLVEAAVTAWGKNIAP
jgi:hypothetical protein